VVSFKRVANYTQWASKEDFDRMLTSPEAQGQMKKFAAIVKSVSRALYLVSSIHIRKTPRSTSQPTMDRTTLTAARKPLERRGLVKVDVDLSPAFSA
jgi:hypothetical protein